SVFAMRQIASPLAAIITLIGCVLYLLLLLLNKYELRKRHRRVDASSYRLSRTYQLRENVMIIHILGPAFLLCIPAFAFRAVYIFLPETFEFYRSLSVSMFDLWISLL
ncbi:hypothetical protein PENTCL1PPCAC_15920, partial [Pristionchus entomophagus]